MNATEFTEIRHFLQKSQKEMARLLGISSRAVQSFEQGWRKVPLSVERQILFLRYKKATQTSKIDPCWEMNNCSIAARNMCPAWEFQAGEICWFINGTICGGKRQKNWNQKMVICRNCDYYKYLFMN